MARIPLQTNATFGLRMTHRGRSPQAFSRFIRAIKPALVEELAKKGHSVSVKMAAVINRDRVRQTSKSQGLAQTIRSDPSMVSVSIDLDRVTIGVGNKQVLDEKHPYWKIVNKGGFTPSPTFGFFAEGSSRSRPDSAYRGPNVSGGGWLSEWKRETWSSKSNNVFMMVPKNPIPAMNFIGKTNAWTNIKWNTQWKKDIARKIKSLQRQIR